MGEEHGMSSSTRRRYHRSLYTVANARTPQDLVALLIEEDIELLIDARPAAPDDGRLRSLCADANTYYAVRPQLARLAEHRNAEPDEHHAWAAAMAMRHRTCVLADAAGVAEETAALVGLRLVDLDRSPAPIALTMP